MQLEKQFPALPPAAPEAAAPAPPARRAGFWAGRRWRPEEPEQRAALRNLVRFFALLLALTLVARGTAGATMARVEIALPGPGVITEAVAARAAVGTAGSHTVQGPAGLAAEEMLVTPGQQVEKGQPVARFDPEKVALALQQERAALAALQQEQAALAHNDAYDGTPLAAAENELAWRQQDQQAAKQQGAGEVAAAQAALDSARAARDAARQARKNLPAGADAAQREAARAAMAQADAALKSAQAALETAKNDALALEQAAARAAESARLQLESARIGDANSRRAAAETAGQKQAAAGQKELDIQAALQRIALLECISPAGELPADADGVVLEAAAAAPDGGAAGGLVRLSDSAGGYQAVALLEQADAAALKAGMAVEITGHSDFLYDTSALQGRLLSLSPPDEAGQVRAVVQLPEGEWKQNQSIDIRVVQSSKQYPGTLPLAALRQNAAGFFVLVVEESSGVLGLENRVREVPVSLLAQDNALVAVAGDFSQSGRVVKTSSKPLSHGDRVRVEYP